MIAHRATQTIRTNPTRTPSTKIDALGCCGEVLAVRTHGWKRYDMRFLATWIYDIEAVASQLRYRIFGPTEIKISVLTAVRRMYDEFDGCNVV